MNSESQAFLSPELVYLQQISASAFYVANRLKSLKILPDTLITVQMGEFYIPNSKLINYSSSKKMTWKLTENFHPSTEPNADIKSGFVLTDEGQILDYIDYGKGAFHDNNNRLLPLIKDGELAKGNIMKNDVIVGLGHLCMCNSIDPVLIQY